MILHLVSGATRFLLVTLEGPICTWKYQNDIKKKEICNSVKSGLIFLMGLFHHCPVSPSAHHQALLSWALLLASSGSPGSPVPPGLKGHDTILFLLCLPSEQLEEWTLAPHSCPSPFGTTSINLTWTQLPGSEYQSARSFSKEWDGSL